MVFFPKVPLYGGVLERRGGLPPQGSQPLYKKKHRLESKSGRGDRKNQT